MAKNNFHSLIKQELVNRFEDVVKNEIREFMQVKSNLDSTISELRNSIDGINGNLKSFNDYSNKNCDRVLDKVVSEKNEFISACTDQLKKSNTTLDEIGIELDQFYQIKNNVSHKSEVSRIHEQIEDELNKLKVLINNKEFNLQYKISECMKQIDQIRESYALYQDKVCSKLDSSIHDFCDKIKNFEINVDGYLKDLQAVKKKAHIQEKYIESIFTRLEHLEEKANK